MGKEKVFGELPFKDYTFGSVRSHDFFLNLAAFLPFQVVFQTFIFNICQALLENWYSTPPQAWISANFSFSITCNIIPIHMTSVYELTRSAEQDILSSEVLFTIISLQAFQMKYLHYFWNTFKINYKSFVTLNSYNFKLFKALHHLVFFFFNNIHCMFLWSIVNFIKLPK